MILFSEKSLKILGNYSIIWIFNLVDGFNNMNVENKNLIIHSLHLEQIG